MDENNTLNNVESNQEPNVIPANDPKPDNEAVQVDKVVSEPSETDIIQDNEDVEIELDPEITEPVAFEASSTENTDFNNIEPIAPIMPQVEKSDYTPLTENSSGKGLKVFAVLIALMVIISACVTGGYYVGKKSVTNNKPVVDLASKPDIENALTASQIYEKVAPSVVGIYVYNETDGISSTATGVIYSSDGYVITNDHIYDGVASPKFKVYTHDKKMYSAEFIAGDLRSDLAVLKIENTDSASFKSAVLGNSNEAVVGENVVAIGRPNGATNPSIASEGIISVVSTRVSTTSSYTSSLIQTDSAINPGSSGGALCNIYGQVIGITSAKLVGNEYDGVGYAIPTTTVKKVVDSLIKYKSVKNRAKLGISYLHIDELTAELSNIPCGLQIAAIDTSSDLYGKSIEINDIITHINGTKITDSNIVLDIIDNSAPGDTLNLKIYLVKKKQTIDITVKLLEDKGSSSYSTKKPQNNSDSNQGYNSSEFSFPNGE